MGLLTGILSLMACRYERSKCSQTRELVHLTFRARGVRNSENQRIPALATVFQRRKRGQGGMSMGDRRVRKEAGCRK